MVDHLTREARSKNMGRIRGKDTKPELIVRKLLHRLGFRFRLHRSDIPGKPDIVLPKYRTVVFVNGCYWHRHEQCARGRSMPSTNKEFWTRKFLATRERDQRNYAVLKEAGWNVIIIWECEIKASTYNDLSGFLTERITK